jgi:hypothetical protein
MKKLAVAFVALAMIVVVGGVFTWSYIDQMSALKHETGRWAVIEDVNGGVMAVETTNNEVWSYLVELNQNGTKMWVGGIVEKYDNKWGFRFKPENVTVTQFTAEGLQATIKHISENIDYWLELKWAYVNSEIIEIHAPA